jgi:hypothetical protein
MQVDRDMGGAAGDPRRRRAHGFHGEGDEDKVAGWGLGVGNGGRPSWGVGRVRRRRVVRREGEARDRDAGAVRVVGFSVLKVLVRLLRRGKIPRASEASRLAEHEEMLQSAEAWSP